MPRIDSATIGWRLRKIREHRGLTQAELGIAVGKSPPTVSAWESGMAIDDADITRCARVLRCRRSDLLGPLGAPLPLCPCCLQFKKRLQRRIAAKSAGDTEPRLPTAVCTVCYIRRWPRNLTRARTGSRAETKRTSAIGGCGAAVSCWLRLKKARAVDPENGKTLPNKLAFRRVQAKQSRAATRFTAAAASAARPRRRSP